MDRRLSAAYREADYETAKRSLEGTVRWLGRISPDAAASLREGLEETLTSALSVTRRVTSRVSDGSRGTEPCRC